MLTKMYNVSDNSARHFDDSTVCCHSQQFNSQQFFKLLLQLKFIYN